MATSFLLHPWSWLYHGPGLGTGDRGVRDRRTVERRDKGAPSKGCEKHWEMKKTTLTRLKLRYSPGWSRVHTPTKLSRYITLIAYLSFSDIKLNYIVLYCSRGGKKRFTLNGDHPPGEAKYPYCTVAALVFTITRLFRQLEGSSSMYLP